MRTRYHSGQTLIEVIIAIGLLMMVMTTIVAGLAVGVRNNRIAKDQAMAKDYSRETLEWFRGMRDSVGFDTLVRTLQSKVVAGKAILCLPALPATIEDLEALPAGACEHDVSKTINSIFYRELSVIIGAGALPTQLTGTVDISWAEGTRSLRSTSTLELYRWK